MIFSLSLFTTEAYSNEKFPLRSKFKGVQVIETSTLAKGFSKYLIMDVRSKVEFDVLHMKGAEHNPVTKITFEGNLKKILKSHNGKTVVFYCNGITCKKSFKAGMKAKNSGIKNYFVYDAGIFTWASTNPKLAVFLGKENVDTKKLISKSDFKKKLIPKKDFLAKAADKSYLVFDIRDVAQQNEKAIKTVPNLKSLPFPKLVGTLEKGFFKGKKILVVDAVGRQVRWLQYYLEENGVKDYYFLDKGAGAF